MFQSNRMCFLNQLTIHKVIIEVWHSGVIKKCNNAVATFLNFYVSHGSVTRFLRNGEKCYIYFINNLFSKSLSYGKKFAKKFDTTFF